MTDEMLEPTAPTETVETPAAEEGMLDKGSEGQPATDTKEPEPKTEEAKPVVPEVYEFNAPEGYDIPEEAKDAFSKVAKAHGFTQEAVNDLLALQAGFNKADAEAQTKTREAWISDIKSDKELGGTNFEATRKYVNAGFKAIETPELRSFMQDSGLINYRPFVQAFAKLGRMVSEPSGVVSGSPAGSGESNNLESLYPNTYKANKP